jgi:tRNA(Ile)-lysidine synthase
MDKIKNYIKRHNLINDGDKIVIAFSGGPDSVYLAQVLLRLREEKKLSLAAVYINHQLLAEAGEHARFARQFCEQHGITWYYFEKDIAAYAAEQKISVEEAGRKFRYQKFYQILEQLSYDTIAVGHHRNDLAETVLYRMARGTGWKGMAGIRPKQNRIIRPLLCISKEEILKELKEQGQAFNVDPSNTDTAYARNQIRHGVLPELCKVNRQAMGHIADLAEQMEEMGIYLNERFEEAWQDCTESDGKARKVAIGRLCSYPPFLRKEVLKRALAEVSGKEKDLQRIHVENLEMLMQMQTGRSMDFPYEVQAVRQYEYLWISKKQEYGDFGILLTGTGRYEVPFARGWLDVEIFPKKDEEFSQKMYTKTFDYDKIKNHAVIRNCHKDDYFVMNAQGQKKKLNRYFIDQKVPKDERRKIPLIADGDHILWIIGGRISGEYKVTKETKRVLQLTWVKMEE